MKIAEFFALITLKGGKESVATLKNMVSTTIAVKSSLIGATNALYKMSDVARESAMFMDMYQLNTGLSAIQLQKLSFQAGQAGVSMTELGGAIQKLQQANARARLGYGWDPIFTRLGLTPGQDPVTQLNRISATLRRLQSTNPAEAKYLASKAGISDSVYYAMLRGTTEEMNKELILTDKEQKALVKLNQQWNKFWFYIKQIVIKLQALGASLQTSVVKLAIRAAQGFYELVKRLYETISASEKLRNIAIALGIALAAAFAPEILGLGALLLVLEDIFTYFEGGDSITGRIVEWVQASEQLKDAWKGILAIFDVIKMAMDGWKMLWQDVIKPMIDALNDFLENNPIGKKLYSVTEKANHPLGPMGHALSYMGKGWDMIKPLVTGPSVQNNNVTVTNHFQSTGDNLKDAQISAATEREQLKAAQNVPSRANGNSTGGLKYSAT